MEHYILRIHSVSILYILPIYYYIICGFKSTYCKWDTLIDKEWLIYIFINLRAPVNYRPSRRWSIITLILIKRLYVISVESRAALSSTSICVIGLYILTSMTLTISSSMRRFWISPVAFDCEIYNKILLASDWWEKYQVLCIK